MCNLQSAKDCASVKTSLATVHARAQEMRKKLGLGHFAFCRKVKRTDHELSLFGVSAKHKPRNDAESTADWKNKTKKDS
jgi:hypothetical protein